jgi:predicted transcriptional regulator
MVEILKTRSRTEIIGLILQAVEEEPLTRSKIMYRAMLNFTQVKDYTSLLTEEDLLKYVMLDKKFAITDKGRQFLSLFNKTNELLTTLADIDNDNTKATDNLQVQIQHGRQQPQGVTLHE